MLVTIGAMVMSLGMCVVMVLSIVLTFVGVLVVQGWQLVCQVVQFSGPYVATAWQYLINLNA